MTSIERTAYPRFKRLTTAGVLQVFFTPAEEEVSWARERTREPAALFALVLDLKCFQKMARFCTPEEILALNIEDLDAEFRRARVVSKGGTTEYVHWATSTARLLPRLLTGRTSGPVFLSDRRAPTAGRRAPATVDMASR